MNNYNEILERNVNGKIKIYYGDSVGIVNEKMKINYGDLVKIMKKLIQKNLKK